MTTDDNQPLDTLNKVLAIITKNKININELADLPHFNENIMSPLTAKNSLDIKLQSSFKKTISKTDLIALLQLFPALKNILSTMKQNITNDLPNNSLGKYIYDLIINNQSMIKDFLIEINLVVNDNSFHFAEIPPNIIFDSSKPFEEFLSNMNFEQKYKYAVSIIYNWSEKNYTPLLRAVLNITKILINKNKCEDLEVGNVISQCNQFWKIHQPQLLPLVISNISIIRNSEAHKNTIVNIEEKSITFINIAKDKTVKKFGPVGIQEIEQIMKKMSDASLQIYQAFRYVKLNEIVI
jgi:hypothetical protein